MKGSAVLCLILFVLLLLIPVISVGASAPGEEPPTPQFEERDGESSLPEESGASSSKEESAAESGEEPAQGGSFRILDTSTGEVLTVDDREFLYGAIVTEMPLSFEDEALKAQAVAAYTCYSKEREQQRENPSEALRGADFSADTQGWYIYTTKEQMQARFGDQYEEYHDRLTKIVDEVYGQTLQYEGELITSVYFAISSGNTEDSADIWGGERDYLVPVASPWDAYAAGYRTVVRLTEEELRQSVRAAYPDAEFPKDADEWIGEIRRTGSGSVTDLLIGGQEVTGGGARDLFGLRSQNFTVSHADGMFVFDVKGWGHGVGMSQVGANALAQQGRTYAEILAWYYPGATLSSS